LTAHQHIILSKQWPLPTGGGLGVARQFFLGLAEIGLEGRDVWAVCGADVVHVTDVPTCHLLAGGGAKRAERNRLVSTICQIQAIHRLSRDGGTIIAFTPFYAWPVLRLLYPRLRLVHVEQSKGGRHHELASMRGRSGLREQAVRAAVALNFIFPHKIVFPGHGALSLFIKMNPGLAGMVRRKGIVIHNGIELPEDETKRPRSGSLFRIIGVCEDVAEKSLPEMLRVIALLRGAGRATEFHHFGTVREETRRTAEAERLPVVFHGFTPRGDVLKAMREADLFLHLPRIAIFDLAVVEAMAAGLPVVATPVGGNLEALGADYPHFAEGPETAACKVQYIMDHREAARGAGHSQRVRDHFSSAIMAGRYLDI